MLRKNRSWTHFVTAGVVVASLSLAGCTGSDEPPPSDPATATTATATDRIPTGSLFAIDAASGTTTADGSVMTLALQPTSSRVVWFGDRPDRSAGIIDDQQLAEQWSTLGFTDDAPNGVLQVLDGEEAVGLTVPHEIEDLVVAEDGSLELTIAALDAETGSPALPADFAAATLTFTAADTGTSTAGGTASDEQSYAQHAASATVDQVEGAAFRLTLGDVSDRTVWFAAEPARAAGSVPTTRFVARWATYGFADVPPNASLTVLVGNDVTTIPVQLATPSYDEEAGTITYAATALADDDATASAPALPADVDAVALVIDDSSTVEADFKDCSKPATWTPAHSTGTYTIEAWGGAGGQGGHAPDAKGGSGGAGGYSVARVPALLVASLMADGDTDAQGEPTGAHVLVGCSGTEGDSWDDQDKGSPRGGGGGGGGASVVTFGAIPTTKGESAACVPASPFASHPSLGQAPAATCHVLVVAGGGGGGGGATGGGDPGQDGGAGGNGQVPGKAGTYYGPTASTFLAAAGGSGGGSNKGPSGGGCALVDKSGNFGPCTTTHQGVTYASAGADGIGGPGGTGGATGWDYASAQNQGLGGAGGEVGGAKGWTGGAGGRGTDVMAAQPSQLDALTGAGAGGGGGGYGGGGAGQEIFTPSNGDGKPNQMFSATGGGGGGSFSQSEGTSWPSNGAGGDPRVRISYQAADAMVPVVTAGKGPSSVYALLTDGWEDAGAGKDRDYFGLHWAEVGTSPIYAGELTFAGDRLVATGNYLTVPATSYSDDNGVTWSKPALLPSVAIGPGPTSAPAGIAAGYDGTSASAKLAFLSVVGPDGSAAVSTDGGETWSKATTSPQDLGGAKVTDVATVGGTRVLAVGGGTVFETTDGATWKKSADQPSGATQLRGIAASADQVMVVDQGTGQAFTAAVAGSAWTASTSPLKQRGSLGSLAYGGGTWVAIDTQASMVNATTSTPKGGASVWSGDRIVILNPPFKTGASSPTPTFAASCGDVVIVGNTVGDASDSQTWATTGLPSGNAAMLWTQNSMSELGASLAAAACP